ncbi:TPA: hypothetical protein ACN36P_002559 [Vibrio parahaemolyticus]
MIFKEFAIGNGNESYCEKRFNNNVNVIFSDDNNRGKTLVLQGMFYAIGNNPIWPEGFDYKSYYFYTKLEIDFVDYHFIRKGSSFIVKFNSNIKIFDSESDLRTFLSKIIGSFPKVHKNGIDVTVDLSTFYEMFFIGQDKRNPSSLISSNYFKKDDFKSMLCQLKGIDRPIFDSGDEVERREKIKNLKASRQSILKKMMLVSKNPALSVITSKTQDAERAERIRNRVKEITRDINERQKKRNRETIRVEKLQLLKNELNSLNRSLELGEVICSDCKSNRIVFKNKEIEFDVSNIEVRNEILKSIDESIEVRIESSASLTHEINVLQDKLKTIQKETPVDLFQIALFSDDIRSEEEYDKQASDLLKEIKELESSANAIKKGFKDTQTECKDFINHLVLLMNKYCKKVDPSGRLNFEDLFSKKNTVYSGSDNQEYYFCRTLAINEELGHRFPIVVDSFRDGELSTYKEEKILDIYTSLGKQVILTSTLKKQEYQQDKYNYQGITSIDYSNHEDGKLLSSLHNDSFSKIINQFGGLIQIN